MIVFTDIDGVLLPGRAYYMPYQSEPIQTVFDPSAVGMLTRFCRDTGAKLVAHSNWRNTEHRRERLGTMSLRQHFLNQCFPEEVLHEDFLCNQAGGTGAERRWNAIAAWIAGHPDEAREFVVLDDEDCPPLWYRQNCLGQERRRVVTTNFDEGLTVAQYMEMRKWLGKSQLILPASVQS